jgi:monofunctional biosynthetic peptidoglycan transglycosylase
VYLNVAQFGRGIWGVEAASLSYFGWNASRLGRAEAALLAAVLPNPIRLRPSQPSPYVRERQAWILGQMERLSRTRLVDELY